MTAPRLKVRLTMAQAVVRFLEGWPLEQAARMGNACGAIVVTRHGCANFMPTRDEVEAFVASLGGWEWAQQHA